MATIQIFNPGGVQVFVAPEFLSGDYPMDGLSRAGSVIVVVSLVT